MACKCTQTTTNATGGGSITSALSACTYPLWINHVSGCTGSALDIHFGNPGANILFNVGQYDYYEVGYGTNNIGINVTNPIHTLSVGGTIDVEQYLHLGESALTGSSAGSVYLGYNAGESRDNNSNSMKNTVVGNASLGSGGVLNNANDNTSIGYGTLMNLTSGKMNTVVGSLAGNALTSQNGNVYLGYGQGYYSTTEENTLRIGNKVQNGGGSTRPLIQGDFATSAATIFGSARITGVPKGDNGFLTIDDDGYLHKSKFTSGPGGGGSNLSLGVSNTGIWTANTTDAAGLPWDTAGDLPGYRSVSISGGTNSTSTSTDWTGTRVGIGTGKPTVPLHVKAPFAWTYVESEGTSSYIASITDSTIAYLGMAAGGGVQSGSTTWRTKSFTSNLSLGGEGFIGTGFSIMRASREVAGDGSTQTVVNPFAILGDTENLDGALVLRGDTNLGGIGGNRGVGIFTARPTKELTVVGSISGTGAIHSTDYLKYPNPSFGTYVGYQSGSGTTSDNYNTAVGYQSIQDMGTASMSLTQRNTAVGYRTLNSAGSVIAGTVTDNVAIGYQSLQLNTGGEYNVGIGVDTLESGVDIDSHVAVGYQVLQDYTANDTGSKGNVGIGYRTMRKATTGGRNVGIGYFVAANSTTLGGYNVYIGDVAANGVDNSGYGNVILGAGAATGGTPANSTIAVGYNAQIPYDDDFFMNIGDIIYARKGDAGTGGRDTVMIGAGSYTQSYTPDFTVGVVGALSATGAIHSTDYIKFPNPAKSVYIGWKGNSGNTTNTQNTSLGFDSFGAGLSLIDGAADNTAIGFETLKSITNATSNTAVGSSSQPEVTTGSKNTSVGDNSLLQMVTGSDNVAIGYGALDESHGDRSTAVGSESMNSTDNGIQNTGLGYRSLYLNNTGRDNVALGHGSMYGGSVNAHNYNTAVGAGSLSGITTGGCNVAVGNNAGAGITSPLGKITTGSNNVVIGCQADIKKGDGDNQTNINNTIFTNWGTGGNTILTHSPIDPIKTHDVYANGDIIIKPTSGLILSASTLGTTIEGPIRTKDPLTFSNTIIGEMAVKYDTKASTTQQNTVVGYQSLSNPAFTGSILNTTLGYKTLSGTTTSRENTAIGANSQQSNTTGGFNTAVGSSALLNNQTGAYNVAIGGDALKGVASNSNSQNVSIGHESGLSITTGNANVFLGYQAGRTLTSGTNNICIGAGTNAVDAAGTRQINIGNVIYGRDVANTGAINSIGIGTTTPGAPGNSPAIPFTVNGAISGTTRLYLGGATAANGNWIDGTQGGSGNDLYINSANDVEIIATDDITLEATGRVEFTEKNAASPSMAIDLNDVSGQAFIENYSGNEVIGINASTRRLYFLWQGAIPATQQTWISGNESNGGEIDLTIGSSNDVIFSATSIGMGTTLPKTKLDVHHDPTGLVNNTGGGEVVTFGSAGADYAAGFLVQLRGASNWVKADADDTTQQGSLLGIALGAAPSDGILLKGFYKINTADDVTTWTNGGQLYVSVTDGKITESTGSMGSGDYVRVVGYMTTTTNVIYFNPESTYLVVT
tara:strand:+ start:63333 stop:67955 length:4623 start_codon:yes stop_codon:yes gene_type:complete